MKCVVKHNGSTIHCQAIVVDMHRRWSKVCILLKPKLGPSKIVIVDALNVEILRFDYHGILLCVWTIVVTKVEKTDLFNSEGQIMSY